MRVDIQSLRGWAVLIVVIHHLKLPFLSAGFLGVDVFFVISGFLITGLITSAIERGNFSYAEFYFRRAKRLLPASYVTLIVTAALAPWFLNYRELVDFAYQLAGALTFTGNIVLLQQTDYFKSASELKPLLHFWSLAVEEQYYFVMPALLMLVPRRRWRIVLLILTIASLALCVAGSVYKPVATFYLFPTRAWEMGIGSLGAVFVQAPALRRAARILFWPALIIVVGLPFIGFQGSHPGLGAVLICGATLMLLIRQHPVLNTGALRPLARVGDMSYSLYLVHWPIIAFANNAWVGEDVGVLPGEVRLLLLLLSLAFAYALNRWVEEPARHRQLTLSRSLVLRTVALSGGLMLLSACSTLKTESADYAYLYRGNVGLSKQCEQGDQFVPFAACTSQAPPRMLVWGDSFAMHLVPGLVSKGNADVVQATRSTCGPLLDLAPLSVPNEGPAAYNERWSQGCINFNASVLAYLARTPSIEVVVLSSRFIQYVDSQRFMTMQRNGSTLHQQAASEDAVIASMRATVAAIRALGKRVVLVAPPPSGGFNAAGCRERSAEGRIMFGASADCQFSRSDYHRDRVGVLKLLDRIPAELAMPVVRFDDVLCAGDVCRTDMNNVSLYRDAGHFSYAGSEVVAASMNLHEKLLKVAR